MSEQPIKRFVSPPPADGAPIPFELEVTRIRTATEERPEDAPEDWTPTERKVQEPEVHSFTAVADVSGGVLVQIDLMAAGTRRGAGVNVRGGDALFDFYDAALTPEDRDRFRKLIQDPDIFVHAQVLTDIAVWLYQTYTNRPTTPPAG
jgi:hypothetical protein